MTVTSQAQQLIAPDTEFNFTVAPEAVGLRLDSFLSTQFTAYSRSFCKNLVVEGWVRVNHQGTNRPGVALKLGDQVQVKFPPAPPATSVTLATTDLGVQILHTHPDFLVIAKPAGLVVHAPRHNFKGVSLVDWLAHHFREIAQVGYTDRPGLVHRLDLQTSGLMLVARNNLAQAIISDKFRARTMQKTYLAVVCGHPAPTGVIEWGITRHPVQRQKMMAVKDPGVLASSTSTVRAAKTSYRVLQYLPDNLAILEVQPETGRMHQIRVHLAALGYPILGDTVYGTSSKLIERQALHAYKIAFEYGGAEYSFTCPLPADLQALVPAELLKSRP